MTVSSESNKNVYTGTGATDTFPYTFRILADTHIEVVEILIATGAETLQVLTTDYTVSGVGDNGGGDVVLVAGNLPDTKQLALRLNPPFTQIIDYIENDDFPAETHERGLDKQTMISKSIQEKIDRMILQPITESDELVLPALIASSFLSNTGPGGVLLWSALTGSDYNGNFLAGLDAAKSATPSVNDIYIAVDSQIIYICYSIGVWTNYNKVIYNGDLTVGTDASKAATPVVNDIHIAIDTKQIYICYSAGVWSNFMSEVNIGGVTIAQFLAASFTLSKDLIFNAALDIKMIDNNAAALEIAEGANKYVTFVTTDGAEKIQIKKALQFTINSPATPEANALYRDNIVKGWVNFNGTGTIAIRDSFNVSSIGDNGVGDYNVLWDIDFSDADYCTLVASNAFATLASAVIAGFITIRTKDSANNPADATTVSAFGIGDQ